MSPEDYSGYIGIFAGNYVVQGYRACDGSSVQINSSGEATQLYAIIGTTYGGDGRVAYKLPDLRGRFPIGMGHGPGLSPRTQGEHGGAESTALTVEQMPKHSHGAKSYLDATSTAIWGDASITSIAHANASATPGGQNSPAGTYPGATLSGGNYAQNANTTMAQDFIEVTTTLTSLDISVETTISGDVTVDSTGGGMPIPMMPPYLGLSYQICFNGAFPPHS